ncbi:Dabb family protein [Porphyromonadaceae bacterium W3.11]|nr:Dabb family protein [Porphyromonadaceae bacterium W3.11]
MIHHIVLFKLSLEGEAKQSQIALIKEQLEALPNVIDELKEIKVSTNINEQEEYDFMLLAVLEEKAHIDLYAKHPQHQQILVDHIKPYLEKRACVDIIV